MKRKLLFITLIAMTTCLIVSCKKDTVVPAPTITSFTPTDGVGAATVTITGTNFSTTATSNTVKFNGTAAVVTASTATSITTTVPVGATTGTITVAVGSNTATSTATFRVDLLFKATINSASEVPVNASTATGTATLTFNTTSKIFTVVVTYTGLTPTAGHIHKAAVGVSGGVIYPFTNVGTSPINYTSAALTTDQETDLTGGLNYVNLHTSAFGGGEIRGQLIKQ